MFKNYLEISTELEKERMIEGGQKGLEKYRDVVEKPKLDNYKKIPEWLIKDTQILNDFDLSSDDILILDRNDNPLKVKNILINYLEQKVSLHPQVPIPIRLDNFRFIIIRRSGKLYWGYNDYSIHQQIIAYAMLLGDIDWEPHLSDYHWSEPGGEDSVFDFACFEAINRRYVNGIFLAESYSMGSHIAENVLEEIKDYSNYDKVLKSIGSSTDELQIS